MSKFNLVKLMWYNNKVRKKYRTVSGSPPISFTAESDGVLKNYRIYGNTVNGESVGELVETGEHAGEYRVPVTVTNGTDTQTTNLYLPEQIRKVGDEVEFVDYREQKQHRVRKNLWNENYDQTIESGRITYVPLLVGEGQFTCSTTCPKSGYGNNIFFLAGSVNTGANNDVTAFQVAFQKPC